jgi:hypothetical protein
MSSDLIKSMTLKATKDIRQILQDCHENNKPIPDWLAEELYEDNILYEPSKIKSRRIKPKIGKKYQAEIKNNHQL